MRRLFLSLTMVFLLVVALASCGGSMDSGSGDTASGVTLYYANWWCAGPQCAIVMGGYTGTAGPFTTKPACE
jgi:hypothetical protein